MQSTIGTPSEIDELVNHDFASYYSEHSAAARSRLQVWVNNSWVAAKCIAFSILLGIPIPFVLFANAANVGVVAGLMFQAGKGDVLLGLAGSARAAGVDGGVPGGCRRHATGLVGDLAGRPPARAGACRAGPRRRLGRGGLVGGVARLGRHRGVRHAVAVADVRADRHRNPAEAAFLGYVIGYFGRRPPGPARPVTSRTRPTWCPTRLSYSRPVAFIAR